MLQEEETIPKVGVTLPIPFLMENSSRAAGWRYITQDQTVRKHEQAIWPSQRRDATSISVLEDSNFIIKKMMDKYEFLFASNSKAASYCERSGTVSFQEMRLI